MAFECTGRSKLAEFMTYHILCYVNGNKLVSVVYGYGVAYKVRGNASFPEMPRYTGLF